MKKLSLLLVPLFFCCLTCDIKTPPEPKPDPIPQLPPATTTGANTFGMLVNGEVWLPKIDPFIPSFPKFSLYYQHGILRFGASRIIDSNSIDETFSVILDSVEIFDVGRYPILEWKDYRGGFFWEHKSQCRYETDSINPGILTITRLDPVNWIVSGTFEMPLMISKDINCTDTLRITEGRFDINYH